MLSLVRRVFAQWPDFVKCTDGQLLGREENPPNVQLISTSDEKLEVEWESVDRPHEKLEYDLGTSGFAFVDRIEYDHYDALWSTGESREWSKDEVIKLPPQCSVREIGVAL